MQSSSRPMHGLPTRTRDPRLPHIPRHLWRRRYHLHCWCHKRRQRPSRQLRRKPNRPLKTITRHPRPHSHQPHRLRRLRRKSGISIKRRRIQTPSKRANVCQTNPRCPLPKPQHHHPHRRHRRRRKRLHAARELKTFKSLNRGLTP